MFTMRDFLVEAERRRNEKRKAEYGRLVRQVMPAKNFNLYIH